MRRPEGTPRDSSSFPPEDRPPRVALGSSAYRKYSADPATVEDAMGCRHDSDDPRKCDRCGEFLWVSEEGLFCGECGVTMPCTMRVLPPPPAS